MKITREDEYAIIAYLDEGVPTTHLKIGPELHGMSDQEVLDIHNECLRSQAQLAADFKYVAVEVPLNSPQIRFFKGGQQWVPRGDVLRCLIQDDEEGHLVVQIDDHELSLEEFGRLLTTHAGWGMRLEFVPECSLHRRPVHAVREPTEREHYES